MFDSTRLREERAGFSPTWRKTQAGAADTDYREVRSSMPIVPTTWYATEDAIRKLLEGRE